MKEGTFKRWNKKNRDNGLFIVQLILNDFLINVVINLVFVVII